MKFWMALAAMFLAGCGSSSPEPTSNAGGGGSGGNGGMNAKGGGGATGGGGAAGAAIVGGSAGAPLSVMDCTTSQDFCIAAQAARDGSTFTCVATSLQEDSLSRYLIGAQSWTVKCSNRTSGVIIKVEFPVQDPGPIHLTTSSNSALQFDMEPYDNSSTDPVLDVAASNLVSGTLDGTLAADLTATAQFTANWGPVGASCTSTFVRNPCAQGSLEMSFHVPLPK